MWRTPGRLKFKLAASIDQMYGWNLSRFNIIQSRHRNRTGGMREHSPGHHGEHARQSNRPRPSSHGIPRHRHSLRASNWRRSSHNRRARKTKTHALSSSSWIPNLQHSDQMITNSQHNPSSSLSNELVHTRLRKGIIREGILREGIILAGIIWGVSIERVY